MTRPPVNANAVMYKKLQRGVNWRNEANTERRDLSRLRGARAAGSAEMTGQ